MAAATGVHIGAISDPQQRACLSASLTAANPGAPQQRDYNDQMPPTFLVTQSLVSLLTEKGEYSHTPDRAEHETNGESKETACLLYLVYYVQSVITVLLIAALFSRRCRKPRRLFLFDSFLSATPQCQSWSSGVGECIGSMCPLCSTNQ